MIKSTHLRLLLVALSIGVALPHSVTAQAKKLKIVFSVPNMAFPWAAFTVRVARDLATKLDIDVLPQDGQSNSPKQSSDLRNAVNQGVDGVLLAP
ncbi:MAG: hypothetical protein WB696_00580, partial [Chthoniobacterales bacterium]